MLRRLAQAETARDQLQRQLHEADQRAESGEQPVHAHQQAAAAAAEVAQLQQRLALAEAAGKNAAIQATGLRQSHEDIQIKAGHYPLIHCDSIAPFACQAGDGTWLHLLQSTMIACDWLPNS